MKNVMNNWSVFLDPNSRDFVAWPTLLKFWMFAKMKNMMKTNIPVNPNSEARGPTLSQ